MISEKTGQKEDNLGLARRQPVEQEYRWQRDNSMKSGTRLLDSTKTTYG
jgi:hypothetical protein